MSAVTFDHVCRFSQFSGRCKRSYVPCGDGDVFSPKDDVISVCSIFLENPQKDNDKNVSHHIDIR